MKEKKVIISKIDLRNIDIANIEVNIPSSKSYLNRALILSSLQPIKMILTNIYNICDDVNNMIEVLKKIGVKIDIIKNKNQKLDIIVFGCNGEFIKPNEKTINCGLGGTTTRFFIGLSSLFDFDIKITAEGKMLERPVGEILDFLKKVGKEVVFLKKKDFLPVLIKNKNNKNIKKIKIDGSKSSQFLSAILMVAPILKIDEIEVSNLVSKSYVNLTLDVLQKFGIFFKQNIVENKITYIVDKNKERKKTKNNKIMIEQDYSSSSYFFALQYLFGIKNDIFKMSKKSSQGDAKFVNIIKKIDNYEKKNNKLKPLILNMEDMPDVSMTAMIICAVKNFTTKIIGLKTLKNKECDRLTAMQCELKKVGVNTSISKNFNSITIYGKGDFELKKRVIIETYNDHRIAMCFAILGTKIGNIEIKNANVVNKSFVNFWQELEKFNCVKFI